MNSGPFEMPQNEKPLPVPFPSSKTLVKGPDGLVIDPMIYAWLADPPTDPDNFLLALRNRCN